MPYTLSMALVWVVLAILLGIVIGWLMRSVVAGRQIERARSNHLDQVELERARVRLAALDAIVAERDRLAHELDVRGAGSPADGRPDPGDDRIAESAGGSPDGMRTDDLTAIDGIGPAVEELCAGIGIHTWDELARTEVSLLRTMLNDAGPRFRSLDPSSWPGQAGLLAAGRPDGSRSSGESAGGDG